MIAIKGIETRTRGQTQYREGNGDESGNEDRGEDGNGNGDRIEDGNGAGKRRALGNPRYIMIEA